MALLLFRLLQGRHQGGNYTQWHPRKQILSKISICRVKIQYFQLKLL